MSLLAHDWRAYKIPAIFETQKQSFLSCVINFGGCKL